MSADASTRRPVITLSELPPTGAVRVIVDGQPVAVVRTEDGEVHAIGDTCTHADVSLAEGEVEDCSIECWLHGSRFDLRTGRPTALPAIRPVPVYPVTVEGDDVFVDVTTTVEAGDDSVAAAKEN
jgi:3-phenylpropionate/trans-cinnamate dioxygenase ferredoxin component